MTVTGGFHHTMWMLDTKVGCFAVKQLSRDIDPGDKKTVLRFETTEAVATQFASSGIPAVCALRFNNQAFQTIDDTGYLVYPWVEATALHREQIDYEHAERVAQIFAQMHSAGVHVPGLQDQEFEVHPEEKIAALVDFAHSRNSSRACELSEHLPLFFQQVARHKKAATFLLNHRVVSHGDLDHKNVLWEKKGDPLLIDWESARRLNPTHEIILEALDWSGITLDFKEGLFNHFISVYLRAGGVGSFDEVEAAFHCVIGDWLNWLMYNVGRSIDLDDAEQRRVGVEQVDLALATLLRLERIVPRLLSKLRHS
ncbi:MAG: aminoglycoside phosphotransferase family protein [Halioglobus sp.]